MKNDPIVEEVRRTREKLAAKFNHDLDAVFAEAVRRERTTRHRGSKTKLPAPRRAAAAG